MNRTQASASFLLALRSIIRNPGRSGFIGFTISSGLLLSSLVSSYFTGMNSNLEEAVVGNNVGNFQYQEKNFSREYDPSSPQVFTEESKRKLLEAGVRAFSPELVMNAYLSTPEGDAALELVGIVPELHEKLLPLRSHLVSGSALSSGSGPGILVGQELTRKFKLRIGEKIVFHFQNQKGELASELLQLQGIFNRNGQDFESSNAYVTQSTWNHLFFGKEFMEIRFNRLPILHGGIPPVLPGLPMKSWKEINPEMAVAVDFNELMVNFFNLIVGVAVVLTLLVPVIMLWQERQSEVKLLTTLGLKKRNLRILALWEAGVLFGAAVLGAALLFGVYLLVSSSTGIDLSFLTGSEMVSRAGIEISFHVYPQFSFKSSLAFAAFSFVSLCACYLVGLERILRIEENSQ